MQSMAGLIARLDRCVGADRRLDAEITGVVLGPQGWVLNPFESVDGWDIEVVSAEGGETSYWMEAADVLHLTTSLEDVVAFAGKARPNDAPAIMARALRSLPPASGSDTAAGYAQRAARAVVVEVLRAIACEEVGVLFEGVGGLLGELRRAG